MPSIAASTALVARQTIAARAAGRLYPRVRWRGLVWSAGGAPDTFLGAGLRTAARVMAEGRIGTPLSAIALMQGPGPYRWHADPDFLFQPGGGPPAGTRRSLHYPGYGCLPSD